MSDWKKIWDGKRAEEQVLLSGDTKSVLLELKRCNGFDVDGELTYGAFYEQYEEIRDNLQKNRQIKSVYEVGCGSGANLYLFEQENYAVGGGRLFCQFNRYSYKGVKNKRYYMCKCDRDSDRYCL